MISSAFLFALIFFSSFAWPGRGLPPLSRPELSQLGSVHIHVHTPGAPAIPSPVWDSEGQRLRKTAVPRGGRWCPARADVLEGSVEAEPSLGQKGLSEGRAGAAQSAVWVLKGVLR